MTERPGPAAATDTCDRPWADTVCCLLLAALLSGCSGFIIPPPSPSDPATVLVLDHGRHSSIVLPLEESGAVRYSYGDWNYYVLDQTGFSDGLRALSRPTQAALGRQTLTGSMDSHSVVRQVRVAVVAILEVAVETSAVRQLREELDALHVAARETRFHSELLDIDFVHHPDAYTLTHNSNRMVGNWLERLGCEVGGTPFLSNWTLKTPLERR